jgi:hypothetical protein
MHQFVRFLQNMPNGAICSSAVKVGSAIFQSVQPARAEAESGLQYKICYKNTDSTSDRRGLRRISPHAKATRSAAAERQSTPINRHLFTARTSGKRRTSSTNFASKGDVLSRLHASANVRGMFKSTTGDTTTVSGHLQRAVSSTHPTPKPLDTRLRMVASFIPS